MTSCIALATVTIDPPVTCQIRRRHGLVETEIVVTRQCRAAVTGFNSPVPVSKGLRDDANG